MNDITALFDQYLASTAGNNLYYITISSYNQATGVDSSNVVDLGLDEGTAAVGGVGWRTLSGKPEVNGPKQVIWSLVRDWCCVVVLHDLIDRR